jgi:hypothetical protein
MSGLQQPSGSSPASLGYGSWGNGKAQQFVKRPAVISEPCSLSRGSFDPSTLGGPTLYQPQRAMRTAKVVDRPDQPHPTLHRSPLTRPRTRFAHQRDKPGAESGLKSLDVGGVDDRCGTALGASEPLSHFSLRAANHAPKDPDHPSAGIPLERLGDHETLRQKKPRPSSLAGANRLAKYLESACLG